MSTSLDDRLRAANAAATERVHLAHLKTSLSTELANQNQRVQRLARELDRERQDVAALQTGVAGFLHDVLGLGAEQMAVEQREALEAQVRLREAVATRDQLRSQVEAIDSRLAALTPAKLEAELRAARAEKEAHLLEHDASSGAELTELDIRTTSLDIELVPLHEAVQTGGAALAVLAELIATIDQARAPSKRDKHVDRARGLAGEAQGKLVVFHRAVDELAIPDNAQPFTHSIEPSDRAPFVDPWLRLLFASGLTPARQELVDRHERLRHQLAPILARRDELAGRRETLVAARDHLLEPARAS
ncbi:MAG: hypothetical protein WKG01_16885 [Kofleriaceae bacterium]